MPSPGQPYPVRPRSPPADAARAALAPLLAAEPTVTGFKFSTKSFGIDAAHVAADAIRHAARTIVDADLSDVIAGRNETDAKEALRIMCEVRGWNRGMG